MVEMLEEKLEKKEWGMLESRENEPEFSILFDVRFWGGAGCWGCLGFLRELIKTSK